MNARVRPARTRPPARRGSFGRVEVGGLAYVAVMTAVAGVAAWPVYASTSYLVVAGAAVGSALVVAVLSHLFCWRWPATAGAVAGAVVLVGPLAAVPVYEVGLARGLSQFFTGLATAWRDLLSVDLPVGGYRNLLVPALVVFAVGTLVALKLSWRPDRGHVLAVPVALAVQAFGPAFGSDATRASAVVGGVTVAAPVEAVLAGASLVASLVWLTWRVRVVRIAALQQAARASGVHLLRQRTGVGASAVLLALTMVVVALAAAAVATPLLLGERPREVLRSGTGPSVTLSRQVSPLAGYRAWFTDPAYGQTLFSVAAVQGPLPDRIRLATLTSYDGEVYSVGESSQFRRVAYLREAGEGTESRFTVTVGELGSLWLPMAGSLHRIEFGGDRSEALADGFYYNAGTGSAVDTVGGGLLPGDSYTVDVRLPDPVDVASLQPGGWTPKVDVPDRLAEWIKKQDQPADGAGLARLAELLRERGYLSHSLSNDPVQPWVAQLGAGYGFRLSAAGHSLGRMDGLFASLLERQNAVEGTDGSLVSAVGDDEQFAVAISLVAEQLGFRSRVVLGARLAADADDSSGVPACGGGVCAGANMSVWTEVMGRDGRWAVIDATPQYQQAIDEDKTPQRDPEKPTVVHPAQVEEIDPPDPTGTKGKNQTGTTAQTGTADLGWLWRSLRIGGVTVSSLGVLAGPFLVVVGAKSLRRRGRRRGGTARDRITGGWDELLDSAVDHGVEVRPHLTRAEVAADFGAEGAAALATRADRAVFAAHPPTESDADQFWQLVDTERGRIAADRSWWRRLRARVSLASFTRSHRPTAERKL